MNVQPAPDTSGTLDNLELEMPRVPETLEETGLSAAFVSDLLLKTLYTHGARTGTQLEDSILLPFPILDDELLSLQQRRLVEVRGAQGRGRRGYTFDLTTEGRDRCREILHTSRYVGPAPVPVETYREWVLLQSAREVKITRGDLDRGFENLIYPNEFLDSLGPAINSGKSIFLYGHAGNGKTSIAEVIADIQGGSVFIPRCVEVDGHIIAIYDEVCHREVDVAVPDEDMPEYLRLVPEHDRRFVRIRRPVVMVGGELTLDELELRYDSHAGLFRAPPQVKANGGVFIIDDFGRQLVRPRDLLNRWMVPLERHVDFLGLPAGTQIPMPFECLLIFATNLNPAELVEEAFLRRIQYKILVDSPDQATYAEIFERCCDAKGLEYKPRYVDFIYRQFYDARGLPARACHPRDIVNHLLDIARYSGEEPEVSEEKLESACTSYFLITTGEDIPGLGAAPSVYDG